MPDNHCCCRLTCHDCLGRPFPANVVVDLGPIALSLDPKVIPGPLSDSCPICALVSGTFILNLQSPACQWGYGSDLDFHLNGDGTFTGCTFTIPSVGGTCNSLCRAEMEMSASISIRADGTCVLLVLLEIQAVTVFGATFCSLGSWVWQTVLPASVPPGTVVAVPAFASLPAICTGTIPSVNVTFP